VTTDPNLQAQYKKDGIRGTSVLMYSSGYVNSKFVHETSKNILVSAGSQITSYMPR